MIAYDQVNVRRSGLPSKHLWKDLTFLMSSSSMFSNLEDASSCFKTFYGPTAEIKWKPQTDKAIHYHRLSTSAGLEKNPFQNVKTSYAFSNDTSLNICSAGYADDTMTFADSWQKQWWQHEWVREFCHAPHFSINAKKTNHL